MSDRLPTVLITGASTGLGAIYADRFAKRGHDLVLVARDAQRLEALATRLRTEAGVSVEVLPADLTAPADLAAIEARVREDQSIGVLINNAGAAQGGGFKASDAATIDRLIALNITALARLATAAGQRFAGQGGGSIINIGSVVGLIPEIAFGVYGGTKAFVHHLSQSMNAELGGQGVYVQAVIPAATRTEIWERGGMDINAIPDLMDAGDLVDAALVGFDQREQVSLPSLSDAGQWQALETARQAMIPNVRNSQPAERYRAKSPA